MPRLMPTLKLKGMMMVKYSTIEAPAYKNSGTLIVYDKMHDMNTFGHSYRRTTLAVPISKAVVIIVDARNSTSWVPG